MLEDKWAITEIAIQLYPQHRKDLTLHHIADHTDYTVGEILEYFDNIDQVLRFFYTSLIIRYRLMIDEIDNFESYRISEKLSNFAFTSFDLMAEHEEFVQATFNSLVLYSCSKTDYQKEVQKLLKEFIENDELSSASSAILRNDYAFNILQHKYLLLVRFWLQDDSDDKQASMELTDKITGLIEELLYTSVADRTLDLLKFLYSNRPTECCDNRFFKQVRSTFEFK